MLKFPLFLKAVLFSVFLLSGCYTVLRHPDVPIDGRQTESESISSRWVDHDSKCLQCHQPNDTRYDNNSYFLYPAHNRWYEFYNSPWWVYPVDDYDPYYSGGGGGIPETNQRRRFGRRTEVTPNSPGMVSVPASTSTESGSTTTSSNAAAPAPAVPTSTAVSSGSGGSSSDMNSSSSGSGRRTETNSSSGSNTSSSSGSEGDRRVPKK